MKERVVTIKNQAGIHCRPSSEILNVLTREYPSHSVEITTGDETVEITGSILALISLGLACGSTATLRIEGHEFDFPPR